MTWGTKSELEKGRKTCRERFVCRSRSFRRAARANGRFEKVIANLESMLLEPHKANRPVPKRLTDGGGGLILGAFRSGDLNVELIPAIRMIKLGFWPRSECRDDSRASAAYAKLWLAPVDIDGLRRHRAARTRLKELKL